MTPMEAAIAVAQGERRAGVHAQRLRDLAAADVRPDRLGVMPSSEREERLWSERNTCQGCGANLHRYASLRRSCAACEASTAEPEPKVAVSYGCGCK